jgi:hypothetical protein
MAEIENQHVPPFVFRMGTDRLVSFPPAPFMLALHQLCRDSSITVVWIDTTNPAVKTFGFSLVTNFVTDVLSPSYANRTSKFGFVFIS